MPNLKALFPTIPNAVARVPALRQKRTSRNFRRWLSTATAGDKNVTDEYLAAIADAKGPLDFPAGKFTKVVTLASVGAALGQAVEGPTGALLGSAAGSMAGSAVDVGLDLLDEFLLDGILKGWHPRMFFDDLRRFENKDPAGG